MPDFSPLLLIFDHLRELNTLSIIVRLLLANLCGSVIGFYRKNVTSQGFAPILLSAAAPRR